jgi:hypothetical protein
LSTVGQSVHFTFDQTIQYTFNMQLWQTGGALPVLFIY